MTINDMGQSGITCPHCGKELPADAKFCISCGKKFAQPQKSRFKVWPILLIVLVLSVVILLCGIIRLNSLSLKVVDPKAYFDAECKTTTNSTTTSFALNFQDDPTDAFYAYAELLAQQDGLDLYMGSMRTSDSLTYIYYGNTGFIANLCEDMGFGHFPRITIRNEGLWDDGRYHIWISAHWKNEIVSPEAYASDVETTDAKESSEKDDPQKDDSKSEQKVKTPKKGVPTIPDPSAFFGGGVPIAEELECTENGHHLYWRLEIDDGLTACYEYVDLLLYDQRFSFEVVEYINEQVLYLIDEFYLLKYTGEGEVNPLTDRYYNHDYVDFTEDVYLHIQKNARDGYTSFCIEYSYDFTLSDLGDRASVAERLSPGSSNDSSFTSSSGDTTPEFAKQDCLTCRGDGDCNNCGGYGKVERYSGNGEYITTSCNDCYGSGDCRTCGGSGKRD